jgi:hypothetical protein
LVDSAAINSPDFSDIGKHRPPLLPNLHKKGANRLELRILLIYNSVEVAQKFPGGVVKKA